MVSTLKKKGVRNCAGPGIRDCRVAQQIKPREQNVQTEIDCSQAQQESPAGQCQQMMIEIAQPPVAKPDRHHTVAGFPLHEVGGSAREVTRNSWRSGCLVLHSVLPLLAADPYPEALSPGALNDSRAPGGYQSSKVRTGLFAGGNRIRTVGPAVRGRSPVKLPHGRVKLGISPSSTGEPRCGRKAKVLNRRGQPKMGGPRRKIQPNRGRAGRPSTSFTKVQPTLGHPVLLQTTTGQGEPRG